MKRTPKIWMVAGALATALLAGACSNSADADGGASGLGGQIVISGSSTVEPISALVAELFAEQNPDVQISVDGPGTGDGFELFCNGETDISDASRPIKEEEIAVCEQNGVDYVELEVALDGITVMTSPENDAVACLATEDLYALVGPESEGFVTWSEANELAADVGGNGGFPDASLDVTAPGEESGTYDAFIELAGFEDIGVERGLSEDEAATTRPDYQASANDNVIIEGVAGSPSSFGWVGYAYYEQNADRVKAIEIDAGSGCVAPGRETIADGSYPLSRSLYVYVNKAKLAENETLHAYVDAYVSDDGLLTAVTEVGYVELPQARIDATRSTWGAV